MFQVISMTIAMISLMYFAMLAICVGLTNTFTYAWLILGIICTGIAIFNEKCIGIWMKSHVAIKTVVIVVCAVTILVVCLVLGIIIKHGVNKPESGADYVIVLGAQVRGTVPSLNLAKRLDKACEYLEKSPRTKVIVSGGQGPGEEITEAEAMEKYLINKGVDKDRIIKESKSINTYENIKFSRKIMNNDNAKVVIVTSSFHVYRGVRICKKQGLKNIEGFGSEIKWYTVPNLYLREAIAVIKYFICGQI